MRTYTDLFKAFLVVCYFSAGRLAGSIDQYQDARFARGAVDQLQDARGAIGSVDQYQDAKDVSRSVDQHQDHWKEQQNQHILARKQWARANLALMC